MKVSEVQQILLVAAAFDNRKADATGTVATIWHQILADVDYEDAKQAVLEHQTGPLAGEYLTVKHIVDAVARANRSTTKLVEADVRAARARGIVPKDHPETQGLTDGQKARLDRARKQDLAQATQYEVEPPEGYVSRPVELPTVKTPPTAPVGPEDRFSKRLDLN